MEFDIPVVRSSSSRFKEVPEGAVIIGSGMVKLAEDETTLGPPPFFLRFAGPAALEASFSPVVPCFFVVLVFFPGAGGTLGVGGGGMGRGGFFAI